MNYRESYREWMEGEQCGWILSSRERAIVEDAFKAGDRHRLTKILGLFSPDLLDRDPSLQKMQKAIEEM